jgi:RNA polymerase sigma-70 factor, ECF subfamily
MEDFELIQLLKTGDDESFRTVVDRYQKFILNTCNKFVYDKETAEDLTQDVFIEVYKSINSFRMDSKLSTWIYRIAVTKSLDYLKSKKRKKRFAILQSLFGEDDMEEKFSAPDEMNPGKLLENQDRLKILNWALEKLPGNQRVAFTLSKYDEMTYQEIAEIMGTSVSAVESLIHRAKANLKKKLYGYYKKHL